MDQWTVLLGTLITMCVLFYAVDFVSESVGMKYEKASDGREYLVRNVPDSAKAANLLSQISKNISKLKRHLYGKINSGNMEKTKELSYFLDQFDETNINERTPSNSYTTYTANKKTIHFCMIARDANEKLHDLNTMMFVAVHECAHIMSITETGHTKRFHENFKFLLKEAVECDIYRYVDYSVAPKKYCGITIKSSPLDNN